MGFYKLRDGRMIELIFNFEGNFERLGDNVSDDDEEAEKIKEEIIKDIKEQKIL